METVVANDAIHRDFEKYKGIFPAFYACYEDDGSVSKERTKKLARYLLDKGVKGLYVGGSSGECIYLHAAERKTILEAVMEVVRERNEAGILQPAASVTEEPMKPTIICHVACNNTQDSQELAQHAESLGVDAIASIPPIYFQLPSYSIAQYWNDVSDSAPNTDFIIYNIPQLAGTALSLELFEQMLENPRVIGVKNSSAPTQDIQIFKDVKRRTGIREAAEVIFNGPDEQLVSGLVMGADGGIGGTYGVMPEVYMKIYSLVQEDHITPARHIQYHADRIIYKMLACHGNMYSVIKEILRRQGVDIGEVRRPLTAITDEDRTKIDEICKMIDCLKASL